MIIRGMNGRKVVANSRRSFRGEPNGTMDASDVPGE